MVYCVRKYAKCCGRQRHLCTMKRWFFRREHCNGFHKHFWRQTFVFASCKFKNQSGERINITILLLTKFKNESGDRINITILWLTFMLRFWTLHTLNKNIIETNTCIFRPEKPYVIHNSCFTHIRSFSDALTCFIKNYQQISGSLIFCF